MEQNLVEFEGDSRETNKGILILDSRGEILESLKCFGVKLSEI